MADTSGVALKLLESVRRANPNAKVWTLQRRWSKSDLDAAAAEQGARAGDDVTAILPNPVAGEVVVSKTEESALRRRSVSQGGVPVREQVGQYAELSVGRQADFSPFTAGSTIIDKEIRPDKTVIKHTCSLGPRVKIDGAYRSLTAGHCARSNWSSPAGGRVGSTLTTAWPGSALRYGDWKVLYGVSYSGQVWAGGIYSNSKRAPWGINWNTLPYGHKLCHSGATTGELCRYQAELNGQQVSYRDSETGFVTRVGRITYLSSSGGLCNGWKGGDSGGAIYYNNGSNRMVYTGLVSGSVTTSSCSYLMAEIGGVRAWNSSATW